MLSKVVSSKNFKKILKKNKSYKTIDFPKLSKGFLSNLTAGCLDWFIVISCKHRSSISVFSSNCVQIVTFLSAQIVSKLVLMKNDPPRNKMTPPIFMGRISKNIWLLQIEEWKMSYFQNSAKKRERQKIDMRKLTLCKV